MKAGVKSDLGRQPRITDGIADLADLSHRRCQRLLAKEGLSLRHGRQDEVAVGGRRRRDQDRFDVGVVDHLEGIVGRGQERAVLKHRMLCRF